MYISLNKQWFDNNSAKFLEASEDGKEYVIEVKEKVFSIEPEEGYLHFTFEDPSNRSRYFLGVKVPLAADVYTVMAEMVTKRMNKFVQELQNLKGFL